MTPKEFLEEARKTMSECTYEYLLLGLRSEIGEINDLLKREIRTGEPVDVEELKEEIGDVLRYAFMALYSRERTGDTSPQDGWLQIGCIYIASLSPDEIKQRKDRTLTELWESARDADYVILGIWALEEYCALSGFTIEECAVMNVEKIRKRIEDGTLVRREGRG